MSVAVASAAALGSALSYATAGVLQHRVARQAPPSKGLHLDLVAHLATRPAWLVGQLVGIPAFGLHAFALSAGPLALVQPLLVSGLLLALPASVALEHRHPSISEWVWAVILVGALGAFLGAGHPTAGHAPSDTDRLAVLSIAGAAIAAGIITSTRVMSTHRAALLGAAGGIGFGITASLLKEAINLAAGADPLRLFASWPLYLLAAVGLPSVVVTQVAYHSGPLAASLPPLTIINPIAAVAIGVLAFHEHVAHSPSAIAAEVISAAVMTAAVTQLARRAKQPPTPIHPAADLPPPR